MGEERNRIKNESGDAKYFTMIPRIVLILCDPFELALWATIKDIAGEKGECWLGARQLAKLAKMSKSQIDRCRNNLIEMKLLEGKLRKNEGQDNAVWHLTVPDLWEYNIRWSMEHSSISSRIEYIEQMGSVESVDEGWPYQDQGGPDRDRVALPEPEMAFSGPTRATPGPTRVGGGPGAGLKNNQQEDPKKKNNLSRVVTPSEKWKIALKRLGENSSIKREILDNFIAPITPLTEKSGVLILVAANDIVKDLAIKNGDAITDALDGLVDSWSIDLSRGI